MRCEDLKTYDHCLKNIWPRAELHTHTHTLLYSIRQAAQSIINLQANDQKEISANYVHLNIIIEKWAPELEFRR